jgi:signal transduction histidine kinase
MGLQTEDGEAAAVYGRRVAVGTLIRLRRRDVVLAAALVLAAEAEVWLTPIEGSRWLLTLCAAAGATATAWRDRAPRTVAVITVASMALPGFFGTPKQEIGTVSVLATLIGIYALGLHAERGPGGVPGSCATLAGLVAFAWSANVAQAGLGGGDFVYLGLFLLVPFLVGRAMGASRRERRAADARAARARADERARIARELHDVIAHSVSVMGLQAGAARKVLPAGLGEIEATLRAIEDTGRATLLELRRMLGMMRAAGEPVAGLAPQPSLAHLDELVAGARDAGAAVTLEARSGVDDLSPGVDLAAYRIVQEALTNARRHAPGAPVRVRAVAAGSALEIEVANDAVRGPADGDTPATGHGIIGMRERAGLYGGTLRGGFEEGEGFVVRAVLPLERAATPALDGTAA